MILMYTVKKIRINGLQSKKVFTFLRDKSTIYEMGNYKHSPSHNLQIIFAQKQKCSGILGSKELHQPFPNLVVKV